LGGVVAIACCSQSRSDGGFAPLACLGANHLQTNHADFGGTERNSAARSPNRTARNGTRRNRRHESTGLITQRSLVQIQPAQRNRWSQAGVGECRPPFVFANRAEQPSEDSAAPSTQNSCSRARIRHRILRARNPECIVRLATKPHVKRLLRSVARVRQPFAKVRIPASRRRRHDVLLTWRRPLELRKRPRDP
jgi:hypothetical protein